MNFHSVNILPNHFQEIVISVLNSIYDWKALKIWRNNF